MVSKKHFKWALIAPLVFIVLAILTTVIFLLTPTIIGALMGNSYPNPNPCEPPSNTGTTANISFALFNLCASTQSFLGVTIMIFIVLAALLSFIPMALTIIDVVKSEQPSSEKAIWVVLTLIFGWFAAAVYYLTKVRSKEN
ncbi:PLDc N-terminal domain-containing protein [Candidatus Micrarchaeota archaeon]|nr:PLDc N-terminal domain-containing protein [Candidatus Micrarchaeota archaeon]